jgi:hypothetical protein
VSSANLYVGILTDYIRRWDLEKMVMRVSLSGMELTP